MRNNIVPHRTVVSRNKNLIGHPWTYKSPSNIAAVQRELPQKPRASSRQSDLPNVDAMVYLMFTGVLVVHLTYISSKAYQVASLQNKTSS